MKKALVGILLLGLLLPLFSIAVCAKDNNKVIYPYFNSFKVANNTTYLVRLVAERESDARISKGVGNILGGVGVIFLGSLWWEENNVTFPPHFLVGGWHILLGLADIVFPPKIAAGYKCLVQIEDPVQREQEAYTALRLAAASEQNYRLLLGLCEVGLATYCVCKGYYGWASYVCGLSLFHLLSPTYVEFVDKKLNTPVTIE